jgi:NaMN:DMB phosphoribosyltransferase
MTGPPCQHVLQPGHVALKSVQLEIESELISGESVGHIGGTTIGRGLNSSLTRIDISEKIGTGPNE